MPSSPICLSKAIRKPSALSQVFLLSSGGKSVFLAKKKVPPHSGFSASMHVVLKTRYVALISTYVDIRATYVAQTYLPRVHNFYPYAEQQPILVDEQTSIGSYTNHYWLIPLTYIGRHTDQYRLLPLSSISPLVTCCKCSYFSELLYGENECVLLRPVHS